MLYSLESDVAYDSLMEFIEFLEKCSKKYNLIYRINAFKGPGGGWPDMTFIGSRNNLKRFWETEMENGEDFEDYFSEYGSKFDPR